MRETKAQSALRSPILSDHVLLTEEGEGQLGQDQARSTPWGDLAQVADTQLAKTFWQACQGLASRWGWFDSPLSGLAEIQGSVTLHLKTVVLSA